MSSELLTLAIILAAAELGGFAAAGLKLPRVAGQIAAGIALGPSLLGVAHDDNLLRFIADVGSLCIMALAGLETNLVQLQAARRPALLAAAGGVVLPFLGALGVALYLGSTMHSALFAGAVLTATSVGVTAATLRELGALDTAAGATILGAAIVDDVLGMVVLGLVIADVQATGTPLPVVGAMVIVLAGSIAVAWRLRDVLVRLLHRCDVTGGGLSGLLAVVLAVAWVYQVWGGLAGITGAYVAGAVLAETEVGLRLRERLNHAGEAIWIPVLFVAIGRGADVWTVGASPLLAVALLAVALVGKLLGSGLGARLGGLDGVDSTTVGLGMIARGEVAFVAVTAGVQAGAVGPSLYATMVVVALATTVVTPVALGLWQRRTSRAPNESHARLRLPEAAERGGMNLKGLGGPLMQGDVE